MAKGATPNETEADDLQRAAQAARENAEAAALAPRGKAQPDGERESDFIEGTDLSGPHQPRKGATFTLEINGVKYRMAPLDMGVYNVLTRATMKADAKRSQLQRDAMRLQARGVALLQRFQAAITAEAEGIGGEDAGMVEAEILTHENEAQANQEALAELGVLGLMEPLRAVVKHCLRDWVRPDSVGINAATIGGLDHGRIAELANACIERFAQGQSNARFR